MKKTEKLFLAINEIDEQLIKNARSEEQKPIEIRPERRSPIKGIIALAACIAVLAVGVFALVKFKLNNGGIDPSPIQNGSDSSISDSASSEFSSDTESSNDSSDSSPKIELTLTEEDLELQAILKDLIANATDIDGIFTRLSALGEGIPLKKITGEELTVYYPVSEKHKTEPAGLFTVPQTRSELEQLLLTCFTKRSAAGYMNTIGTAHIMTDLNGKSAIVLDQDRAGYSDLLDADGKLYYHPGESSYKKIDIDYTLAQVTLKTDKTVKFTYYDSSGTKGKTEGVIVLEDGGWKLDFFHGEFIPELPTEFTDEDLELQEILNGLSKAETVFGWFYIGTSYPGAKFLNFRFNDPANYEASFVILPKGQKSPYSDLEYPQSCEEVEELLLKYFTQNTVDLYMKHVVKASMTENPDGTYTISADDPNHDFYRNSPAFIEIDGNMYIHDEAMGGPDSPIWYTAKITERTQERIKFTVIYVYHEDYYPKESLLKFERGGWRINYDFSGISAE